MVPDPNPDISDGERRADAPPVRRQPRRGRIAPGRTQHNTRVVSDDEAGEEISRPHSPSQASRVSNSRATPTEASATNRPSNPREAQDVNHFFKRGKNIQSVCKWCKAIEETNPGALEGVRWKYSENTGTSPLRVHLENHHAAEYIQICHEKGWPMLLPKKRKELEAQAAAMTDNHQSERPTFSHQVFLEHLINFIVADDQSISVIECPEFRRLLLVLRVDLQEKDIPRRTKIRSSIITACNTWYTVLKSDLAAAAGQISFTADVWSDRSLRPYLAITAHWLARDVSTRSLQLQTALLAFHRLQGSHDGKSLANAAIFILDRAKIVSKLGHFTLDNASNNGTFMTELANLLHDREAPDFDPLDRRIMCFPHVINICCQHVIESLTNLSLAQSTNIPQGASSSNARTFEDAVKNDPVALGRTIVRIIRSSGQRRDAFDEHIRDGNAKGWFRHEGSPTPVQLPLLQLLHDVRTRWDSVYFMIQRLRILRPAIDHFLALNADLTRHKLNDAQWGVLRDFEIILEVPHRVQQAMSSESLPILAGAIPAFEMFMTSWELLRDKHPRLRKWVNVGLSWAAKYYSRMDRTRSYIVAMFLHPAIRMSWIRKHWDDMYIRDAEQKIKEIMTKYRNRSEVVDPLAATTSNPAPTVAYASLADQYGLENMRFQDTACHGDQSVEQEYQGYITAVHAPITINILKFWELNEAAFPTIFAMALDYLPIQASAVPAERVFSSSAETDTKKRNRINPALMESLQILKFGLKKSRLNFTENWITPISAMSEREPDPTTTDLLSLLLQNSNTAETSLDMDLAPTLPSQARVLDLIIKDIAADDSDAEETL
ncbi:hypothetical protein M378DRAFT_188346 [Amanita muscaria Koide BX008]|uniref:HAT C-terminal dimerisation domain-containing protein n=1 Tax=Amanita muscaria (strain Koide BX008) TaxID=946122 RepID=A0A0C2WP23_AMAMK|nr:hypothetical protein M378DRAFT_188346 [Amanita muscaria Koide BX008]